MERLAIVNDNYETAILAIVDAAPPLSDAQRDRLAALLGDDHEAAEAA